MQLAIPIFRISEDPNAQDPQMGEPELGLLHWLI